MMVKEQKECGKEHGRNNDADKAIIRSYYLYVCKLYCVYDSLKY